MKPALLILISSSLATVLAGVFLDATWIGSHYYIILLTLGLWIYWSVVRQTLTCTATTWAILGVSLLGTLFLVTREPMMFKKIPEEPQSALIAMNLSVQRKPVLTDQGIMQDHGFVIKQPYLDKRPLLFPSLLAALHDGIGYHPGNVFVLNAILIFVLLMISAYIGLQLNGFSGAIFTIALLLTIPLLAQQATSGGGEILHLVMLASTLLAAQRYLASPDTNKLISLLLSGLLLAQVHTESALFLLPVAAVACWGWYKQRLIQLNQSLALIPLLLIPIVMHLVWVRSWPAGLDWGNKLSVNLFAMLEYYLWLAPWSSMHATIGWLILPGLAIFSYSNLRALLLGKSLVTSRGPILVFAPFVLLNLLFHLSQTEGNPQEPAQSAFTLPLTLLAILATTALVRFTPLVIKSSAIYLAGNFYFLTLPATSSHYYTTALGDAHYLQWAENYFRQRPATERYLIISKKNALFLLNHQSSLIQNIAILRATQVQNLLNQKLVDTVYVLQSLYFDPVTQDFQIAPGHALGKQYQLEPLARYRFNLMEVAQISQVVAITPDPADRPAHYPGFVEEARTGKLPRPPISPTHIQEQAQRLP